MQEKYEKNFSPESHQKARKYTGYNYNKYKKVNRGIETKEDEEYLIHFNEKTQYSGNLIRAENDMETIHFLFDHFLNKNNEGAVVFPFASFSESIDEKSNDVAENFKNRYFIIKAKCDNIFAEKLTNSQAPDEKEVLVAGCNNFKIQKIEYLYENGKKNEIGKDGISTILKLKPENFWSFGEFADQFKFKILITGAMTPNLEKFKEHQERYNKMNKKEKILDLEKTKEINSKSL